MGLRDGQSKRGTDEGDEIRRGWKIGRERERGRERIGGGKEKEGREKETEREREEA